MAWAILAGISATFAIVHAALGVPERLKRWDEIKKAFAACRIDLETLRYRMGIDSEFPVEEFTQEFVDLRRRYSDGIQRRSNDILRTKRLRNRAQSELNERLEKTT